MRINRGGTYEEENPLLRVVTRHARTVFQISVVVVIALYAYLLYGLFTGQLGNSVSMSPADQARIMGNIERVSTLMNLSLLVMIVSGILCFYESIWLGYSYLLISALMAYGLQFAIQFFFAQDAAKYTKGEASEMTLHQIWFTGMMFGIAGLGLVIYQIVIGIKEGRYSRDLAARPAQYGKDVAREKVSRPLLPITAKCWQLPYCREGIRKQCPIYHARTKCWHERTGCMCEENIIRLATADAAEEGGKNPAGVGSGFVPLGDLLTASAAQDRKTMTTRVGPRGVRIPTNPHLTDHQKRERCRNCVIYNEHQKNKYQMFAPLVVLAVPALVWLNFDTLRGMLTNGMNALDHLIAHISFTTRSSGITSDLTTKVTSSMSVEAIIIVCLTLMALTWALRFLEYCIFDLKI